MADLLIIGVSDKTVHRLTARAHQGGRTLEDEVRLILERATQAQNVEAIFDHWKKRFAGRRFQPSSDLIRGDRDR